MAPSKAQIVPDDTLGSESSTVIDGGAIDRIGGGASRGANLFHSFEEFNINTGQQVYFINPEGIDTILSRVTGSNLSDIDGLLGVDGIADLFLLNPNGIMFGPNAELDMSGSFTASTADTISFLDGGVFSAIAPTGSQLLTMSVPLGVQRGAQPQGDLTNEGNLAVEAGQSLTLFGNTVRSSGVLTVPAGRIEVLGNQLELTEQAQIDVSGEQGGGIVLVGGDYQGEGEVPNAQSTFVARGVLIRADALANGDGGQVIIWADGETEFLGGISARGGEQGGNSGFVETSGAQRLFLGRSAQVDTRAVLGQAGTWLLDPLELTINRNGEADIVDGSNSPDAATTIAANSVVTALDSTNVVLQADEQITVAEPVLADSIHNLTLNATNIQVNHRLQQSGGGSLILRTPQEAGSSVNIVDRGGIDTVLRGETAAESGDIEITTHDLSVTNGLEINASVNSGQGDSGRIVINATGDVVVDGADSFIRSQIAQDVRGDSGGVSIRAGSLFITNGGEVSADSRGTGNPGQISIVADENVSVEGTSESRDGSIKRSLVRSQVNNQAQGNAEEEDRDDIIIRAENDISVAGGAIVTASTLGQGNSGRVVIAAGRDVVVRGSGEARRSNTFPSTIRSEVAFQAEGNSAGVSITAGNDVFVIDGATVTADTRSRGDSGQVIINAEGNVEVRGRGSLISSQVNNLIANEMSELFNDPTVRGDSGGVSIEAGSLSISNGGAVRADTLGRGNSGQVSILVEDDVEIKGGRSLISSEVDNRRNLRVDDPTVRGDSGGVLIDAGSFSISSGGVVSADTQGRGDSGQVVILVEGDIKVEDRPSRISSRVLQGAEGDSNGILIEAGNNVSVVDLAEINASTRSQGSSGLISIDAEGDVLVRGRTGNDRSLIISQTTDDAKGESKGVLITAATLFVRDGAEIVTDTRTAGESGPITINTSDRDGNVVVEGEDSLIRSQVNVIGRADSGGVSISTADLSVLNGGEISANTLGEGNSGKVEITAENNVRVEGRDSFILSQVGAQGNGQRAVGDSDGVLIIAEALSVLGGAVVSADTLGEGNSGKVNITARGDVVIEGSSPSVTQSSEPTFSSIRSQVEVLNNPNDVNSRTIGNSGGVSIVAENLYIRNGGRVRADTSDEGDSGQVNIDVSNDVKIEDEPSLISSRVRQDARGNSSGVLIEAGNDVSITNLGEINASTRSAGNSGLIEINAEGDVVVDGRAGESRSLIISQVTRSGTGKSEGVSIMARNLFVGNGAEIITDTRNQGDAGPVSIDTTDGGGDVAVEGEDSRIRSQVSSRTATGNSGGVSILTENLFVRDGAEVSANTLGEGNAGQIEVVARGNVEIDGRESLIGSEVNLLAVGNSEGVSISTESISISDGAEVSASAEGRGTSGQVFIEASLLGLQSGGSVSATTSNISSDARGGNIVIQSPDASGSVEITSVDGTSQISASTTGGGDGGSITIRNAEVANLRNVELLTRSGESTASTAMRNSSNINSRNLGRAGDIIVEDVDVLLMRRGSLIQAGASGNADGGNVDIEANVVLTISGEDNDILANARLGAGGNINITADQIIGFQEVEQFSDNLRNNAISDISARSESSTDGQVNLNNLFVDPTQGLTELPEDLSDPSDQIARGCSAETIAASSDNGEAAGQFIITGRGGQPLSPTDISGDRTLQEDLGPSDIQTEATTLIQTEQITLEVAKPPGSPLADSQHAVVTESGDVFLVAAQGSWQPSLSCSALR
ncbi:MAG: filamentous hemagglutinin N-terminal domain-containing protein [Cyanobacteria bacterium P01_D01_bin.1]